MDSGKAEDALPAKTLVRKTSTWCTYKHYKVDASLPLQWQIDGYDMLCVYIYMCIYIYICVQMCIYIYIYLFRLYVCMHILYMCIVVYMYICIKASMHLCIYVHDVSIDPSNPYPFTSLAS